VTLCQYKSFFVLTWYLLLNCTVYPRAVQTPWFQGALKIWLDSVLKRERNLILNPDVAPVIMACWPPIGCIGIFEWIKVAEIINNKTETVNLCDVCGCRCSLRANMLYFGWLLPMSIIILHNLVVFVLVVRVLTSSHPGHAPISSNVSLLSLCKHSLVFVQAYSLVSLPSRVVDL